MIEAQTLSVAAVRVPQTRRSAVKGTFAEEEQVAEPVCLDRTVNNRRAVIWQKMKSYLHFA